MKFFLIRFDSWKIEQVFLRPYHNSFLKYQTFFSKSVPEFNSNLQLSPMRVEHESSLSTEVRWFHHKSCKCCSMSISECHVINVMIWYCTITSLVKTADKRRTPGEGAHLGEHRQRWIGRPGDRKVPFSSPPILIEFLFIKTTDGIDSVLAKLGQILNLLLIRLPCDRKSGSFPFLSQLNSTQLSSTQLNCPGNARFLQQLQMVGKVAVLTDFEWFQSRITKTCP